MVKPGGIIAIDDSGWVSISKMISYVLTFENIIIDRIVDERISPRDNIKDRIFTAWIKLLYLIIPFARKKYFFSDRVHNPYAHRIKNSSMVFLRKTHDSVRHWKWFEQF